mmetsp:Transcript_41337/g.74770  ORF Transcript_41337/g.74770 Transcript_41337/m.74770 type:complete len:243 (+) Transcript_41337:44-772(+)
MRATPGVPLLGPSQVPAGGAVRHEALERELQELQAESDRNQRMLETLNDKARNLRAEVDRQRRMKPAQCSACRAVTLQVDAAAQSLIGAAGHVARTLLRDADADRGELLGVVLRYLEPVKHLDPDLEELYVRAEASRPKLQVPPRATAADWQRQTQARIGQLAATTPLSVGSPNDDLFSVLDTNRDGVLSRQEFAQMGSAAGCPAFATAGLPTRAGGVGGAGSVSSGCAYPSRSALSREVMR